jgi:hypothetical protein
MDSLIIGFADEFYTLWSQSRVSKSFIKNISKDINVVKELYPNVEIDLGLRGYKYREYNFDNNRPTRLDNQFPFGKYQNYFINDILKLDFNYCLWVVNSDTFDNEIKSIITNSKEYNNYIDDLQSKIQYLKVGEEITHTFDRNISYLQSSVNLRLNNVNINIINIPTKQVDGLYPYSKGLVNGKYINFKNRTFTFKVTNIINQGLDIKYKSGEQEIEVEIL